MVADKNGGVYIKISNNTTDTKTAKSAPDPCGYDSLTDTTLIKGTTQKTLVTLPDYEIKNNLFCDTVRCKTCTDKNDLYIRIGSGI